MKTKLLMALAIAAGMFAASVAAKTVYETGDYPTTGWESPGGWGGLDGFGGIGPGGDVAFGGDPGGGVLVICVRSAYNPYCPATLTPGVDTINLGAPAVGDTTNRDGEPEQIPPNRQDCVNDCTVKRTMNNNLCVQGKDALRTKLTTIPATAGMWGILFKVFKGGKKMAPDPDWTNIAYGLSKDEIERKLADFDSTCNANASRAENVCLEGCPALMLPLALLPLRRRYNDEVEERALG